MILMILGVFTHLTGNTNAQLTRSIGPLGSLTETCCQPMSTNHFQSFEQPTSIQHITFNKSYFTGHFQLKHVQHNSSTNHLQIIYICLPYIFFTMHSSSHLFFLKQLEFTSGLFANFHNSQEAVHWPDFKSLFAQLERGHLKFFHRREVWDLIF